MEGWLGFVEARFLRRGSNAPLALLAESWLRVALRLFRFWGSGRAWVMAGLVV